MPDFSLSDPYTDFDSPEDQEMLRCIESKQGVGITGYDLMCVFQSWLPAGTPRECCAYLPALYDFLRCPGDEYVLDVWDSVIWVWLVQEREELENLGQHKAIVEELRSIVREVLIAAPWQPENGVDIIYNRMDMLMNWMASPWGQEEMESLLDMLLGGGVAQHLILLRLFTESREAEALGTPIAVHASEEAYLVFVSCFDAYFADKDVLRKVLQSLHAQPVPESGAEDFAHLLMQTREQCEKYL